MELPVIHQGRCTKTRFVSSNCNKCFSVCPVDAISFDGRSLQISSLCNGCRFCMIVCPNEAISFREHTKRYTKEDGSLPSEFVCSRILPDKKKNIRPLPPEIIPCIGSIPLSFLLNRLCGQDRPLRILTAGCHGCELEQGVILFQEALSRLETLVRETGREMTPPEICPAAKTDIRQATHRLEQFQHALQQEKALSRRDFFTGFAKRFSVKEESSPAPEDREKDIAAENNLTERLKGIILFYRERIHLFSEDHVSQFFSEIEIQSQCNGCSACAAVCPTGALSLVKSQTSVTFNFLPSHCTLCGLCQEACAHDAIEFIPGVGIHRILRGSKTAVKSFALYFCSVCSREYLSTEKSPECPHCLKDQQLVGQFSKSVFGECN